MVKIQSRCEDEISNFVPVVLILRLGGAPFDTGGAETQEYLRGTFIRNYSAWLNPKGNGSEVRIGIGAHPQSVVAKKLIENVKIHHCSKGHLTAQ